MIPIRDENPARRSPVVTISLIVLNCVVYVYQLSLPQRAFEGFVHSFGAVPLSVSNDFFALPSPPNSWLTLLTSMFMHGGFLHLAGNMLYLWIFGNNIEDRLGHVRFILFYLVGGIGAALTHILIQPASSIPMIGASGAISAVLGAYMILFPRARVVTLIWLFIFIRFIRVPAFLVLGIWFVMQISGVLNTPEGGIAWYAHIGGFVAGIVLIYASGTPFTRQPRWF